MSRRYDGKQADVWSLGVCLFALVLGIFPVEEASRTAPGSLPETPRDPPRSRSAETTRDYPRLPETTKDRASSPHGAQASDKDPRFEALKRAQLDRRSSVDAILCLYRREDQLSPALTERDAPSPAKRKLPTAACRAPWRRGGGGGGSHRRRVFRKAIASERRQTSRDDLNLLPNESVSAPLRRSSTGCCSSTRPRASRWRTCRRVPHPRRAALCALPTSERHFGGSPLSLTHTPREASL